MLKSGVFVYKIVYKFHNLLIINVYSGAGGSIPTAQTRHPESYMWVATLKE